MKKNEKSNKPKDEESTLALQRIEAAYKDPVAARALAGETPRLVEFFKSVARARHAWVERLTGRNELAKLSVNEEVEQMRTQLLGPNPSGLERALVERVIIAALQANHFDLAEADPGDRSLHQAEFALKRQDRAHRRYLLALRTLAEVRRIATPAIRATVTTNDAGLLAASTATERRVERIEAAVASTSGSK